MLLEARDLHKEGRVRAGFRESANASRASRIALDIFTAKAGEVTAIIGPSGSGKSSLLNLLAGVEQADAGAILIDSKEVSRQDLQKYSSMVMQNPVMIKGSVLYNCMLGPRFRGVKKSEAKEIAMQHLEKVALQDLAKESAAKLSGGEKVRLALARALAKDADILLLDEATANLDPQNIERIETVIRSEANSGKIVVVVTHNLAQAQRIGSNTAVIYEGRLICQDGSQYVTADHPNAVVSDFLAGRIIY